MTVSERERLVRVALNRLGEPGDVRMTALAHEHGAETLHRLILEGGEAGGLRADVAARLAALDPAGELERAARVGLRFVVPGDDEWPRQLDDLADAAPLQERGGVPVGLWVRGPVRLDELGSSVAVVGSRAATTYGDAVAAEIAAVVGRSGRPVVSGGAFGIDVAAHRGALSAGAATVAVLACGADRVYPQAHRDLIEHLGRSGAVVSEAAPGCAPLRIRFLARNRLIAALGEGTVVVEAAHRSGALNTANWADRLHRRLMGVPGPVTSASSAGVHDFIRAGGMTLVTSGADVLEMVGGAGEALLERPAEAGSPRDGLSSRQRQVLDAVPVSNAAGSDSIARVAGLGVHEVGSTLVALREAGMVEGAPGGWRLTGLARA